MGGLQPACRPHSIHFQTLDICLLSKYNIYKYVKTRGAERLRGGVPRPLN